MIRRSHIEEHFALLYAIAAASLQQAGAPWWLVAFLYFGAAVNWAGSWWFAYQENQAGEGARAPAEEDKA